MYLLPHIFIGLVSQAFAMLCMLQTHKVSTIGVLRVVALNCLLYCLLPWPVFGHCLSTVPSMSFILFWVKPFLVHYFVFGLWFIGTDLVIAWQRVRNLMCPMVILPIWSVLLGAVSQADLASSTGCFQVILADGNPKEHSNWCIFPVNWSC